MAAGDDGLILRAPSRTYTRRTQCAAIGMVAVQHGAAVAPVVYGDLACPSCLFPSPQGERGQKKKPKKGGSIHGTRLTFTSTTHPGASICCPHPTSEDCSLLHLPVETSRLPACLVVLLRL